MHLIGLCSVGVIPTAMLRSQGQLFVEDLGDSLEKVDLKGVNPLLTRSQGGSYNQR